MPSDASLHPAHVVAIRPDIDGEMASRGDYILSVETPSGARNVMAPTDGSIEIQVQLMQQLMPETVLFRVSATKPAETAASQPTPPIPRKGRTVPFLAFCLIILVIAGFLPGLVWGILGAYSGSAATLSATATVFGLILLVFSWYLAKLLNGSTTNKHALAAVGSVVVFSLAMAAGLWSPTARTIQEQATAPVARLANARLRPVFVQYLGQPPKQLANSQNPIDLPVVDALDSSAENPMVGDIILVGFNFCPRGWISLDGRLLAVSRFAALYSVLGTQFGGDGRTTFQLPDLRGRAPVHAAGARGNDQGSLGQMSGTTDVLRVAAGSDDIGAGVPYAVINYCMALHGMTPPES